jgi:hypothetical protein
MKDVSAKSVQVGSKAKYFFLGFFLTAYDNRLTSYLLANLSDKHLLYTHDVLVCDEIK